jgi:DNA sulfur modification protein DndB
MELHPALQGQLGTWKYYATKMTARALASNVRFAGEVWSAKALNLWIQRALNASRAKTSIASYLAQHDDRFFNSIVVAAIDGNPTFFAVSLAEDPRFEMIADKRFMEAFGVLRFDGTQRYYALDGQHRLRAIRALLDEETEYSPPAGFENEEFSVLIVVPKPGEPQDEFLKKYRRLFSHLNRYAKSMDRATTIVMEEDDAIAIVTRGLIADHPFFSYVGADEEPRVRPETPENMSAGEPYFTSIEALYKANTHLLYAKFRKSGDEWGSKGSSPNQKLKEFIRFRPEDAVLEALYKELALYWDAILAEVPALKRDPKTMRTDLSDDEDLGDGSGIRQNHLLFRPLGLNLFSQTVRDLLDAKLPDPSKPTDVAVATALKGLGVLEWRLYRAPWRHLLFVYDSNRGRWRMRNEERKEAAHCGHKLLRYITGLQPYNSEMLKDLQAEWRSLLVGCDDVEAASLWEEITHQADIFVEAQG